MDHHDSIIFVVYPFFATDVVSYPRALDSLNVWTVLFRGRPAHYVNVSLVPQGRGPAFPSGSGRVFLFSSSELRFCAVFY